MHRTIGGILIILTLAALTGSGRSAAEGMTPSVRAVSTSKGQLKSPYSDFASVAEEGHRKYMAAGCNGCHGGGGGGGMAAPLTNPVWIYGDDDDTLFRLIALGTGKLSPGDAFGRLGYRRKGSENVVGPMPHFGEVIKTDDDLWKIIAWIRSIIAGGERQDVDASVAHRGVQLGRLGIGSFCDIGAMPADVCSWAHFVCPRARLFVRRQPWDNGGLTQPHPRLLAVG
jgi:mono/diheme cytochrome c family protein